MANIIKAIVYVDKVSCPKCINDKAGCFLYNYYILNHKNISISETLLGNASVYQLYSMKPMLKEGQFKRFLKQINNICGTCKAMHLNGNQTK